MLGYPTDEKGYPIAPAEQRQSRMEYLYALAVKRGMIHERAILWAKAEEKAAFLAGSRNGQQQKQKPKAAPKPPQKPRRKRRGN